MIIFENDRGTGAVLRRFANRWLIRALGIDDLGFVVVV